MNSFCQISIWSVPADLIPMAISNGPTMIVLIIAFRLVYYKMKMGFKDVRTEMEKGFLMVNNHLENHDREIKGIKRDLKKINKRLNKLEYKK